MKAAVLYEVGKLLAIEDLLYYPPKRRVRGATCYGVFHSDLHYIGDRPI